MASVYDTKKMVVNITHADSEYYYDLATRHEPIIDCFVTYTPHMYSRLCELLPNRRDSIFLLPYGISIPEETRKPHSGPVRLLYVGRLNRWKGVFDLPKIDCNLRQRGVEAAWTVQGTGPDAAELKADWPNEFVRWCGRQPYEQVLDLYNSHDVLVMPSRSEGLPVALLEATARGLVPVASDLLTGMRDVVDNGVSGYLLPVGDTDAFAESIATLANDRDKLERMSHCAREICAQKFNMAHLVGGYQELYARWQELKRPRPANFGLQYGSRLDQHWIPNAIVKLLRSHLFAKIKTGRL
jgi:glycosyltransferase involved in cell wall biosynthesis